ncbi:hypothetical protein T439DRAFT_182896 [Meredithblackwellia eburnea MCA 4105]
MEKSLSESCRRHPFPHLSTSSFPVLQLLGRRNFARRFGEEKFRLLQTLVHARVLHVCQWKPSLCRICLNIFPLKSFIQLHYQQKTMDLDRLTLSPSRFSFLDSKREPPNVLHIFGPMGEDVQ